MAAMSVASFVSRQGPRQFVKFCIVGATSTVIDFGTLNLLHYYFHLPLMLSITVAFLLAVTNGFYWNRRWTFRAGRGDVRRQYPLFLATNVVGYLLNVTIMTTALYLGSRFGYLSAKESLGGVVELMVLGQGKEVFPAMAVNIAKAAATVCVTAWNFTAAKFLTFRS